MKCDYVKVGDITAIVCSSGRRRKSPKCVKCGRLAMRQCDWKIGQLTQWPRTCDAFICNLCTVSPESGKDLCPEHAELWAKHPRNQNNEANSPETQNVDEANAPASAQGNP